MTYTVTITADDTGNLFKALKPEETSGKRFGMKVQKTSKQAKILITAADATALKAITASVTKLCEVAEKIHGTG